MKNIIIAGCGGGCDIYGGIPLYMSLKNKAENIILTNLSFTKKVLLDSEASTHKGHVTKITETMYVVDASDEPHEFMGPYSVKYKFFPEYYLSKELQKKIYILLEDSTINELTSNYKWILNNYKDIYHIYLIDGGCDVLLSGIETGLASPVEDMMHMKAISYLDIENKFVCAIGLNIDVGHGVIESELIDRLNYLSKEKILLNKQEWFIKDDNVKTYYDIVNRILKDTSIVHALICASLDGFVGYHMPSVLKTRIKSSKVFLSKLTRTFCTFNMNSLMNTILYFDKLEPCMNTKNVDDLIEKFVLDMKN